MKGTYLTYTQGRSELKELLVSDASFHQRQKGVGVRTLWVSPFSKGHPLEYSVLCSRSFPRDLTSRCGNLLSDDSCISFPVSFHIALLVLFGIMFQTMTYTQIFASLCVAKGTQPEAITMPLPAQLSTVRRSAPRTD